MQTLCSLQAIPNGDTLMISLSEHIQQLLQSSNRPEPRLPLSDNFQGAQKIFHEISFIRKISQDISFLQEIDLFSLHQFTSGLNF